MWVNFSHVLLFLNTFIRPTKKVSNLLWPYPTANICSAVLVKAETINKYLILRGIRLCLQYISKFVEILTNKFAVCLIRWSVGGLFSARLAGG